MTSNEKLLKMLKVAANKAQLVEYQENFFKDLENTLEDNIREEIAKGKGNKSQLSIVKKIIKAGEKSGRDIFTKAIPFTLKGKNYYGFTEAHYIVASGNDFDYPVAEEGKTLNIASCFDTQTEEEEEIKIDLADLKLFTKTHKVKKGETVIPYQVQCKNYIMYFNPQFLLDVLSFCSTDILIKHGQLAPAHVYGENKDNIGLVMPICPPKNA